MRTKTSGQVMLLAVGLIGASILTATTIAGYLMLQRIKMASNFIDSTKAVFAADSGIECELYKYNFSDPTKPKNIDCAALSFGDGKTSVKTSIITDASSTPQYIKSIGTSNKSNRAFMMNFVGATSTLP
ncbi:MAG: hypothetical protein AAB496_01120 [Patescibacteria group bacterium]